MSEGDREASIMRRPLAHRGYSAIKKKPHFFFVALVAQYSKHMRRTILLHVSCPVVIFPHYIIKGMICIHKATENKIYVLIFYTIPV